MQVDALLYCILNIWSAEYFEQSSAKSLNKNIQN